MADEPMTEEELNVSDTVSEGLISNEYHQRESVSEEIQDIRANNGLLNDTQEQEPNPVNEQTDEQSNEQPNEIQLQNDQSEETLREDTTQKEEILDENHQREVESDEVKIDQEQLLDTDETLSNPTQVHTERSAFSQNEAKSQDNETKEPSKSTQLKDKTKSEDVAEGPATPWREEIKSESQPPAWMTLELFQEALSAPTEGKREHLTVTGIKVKPAVEKGDNYASVLFKVRLEVLEEATTGQRTPGHRELIVKSLPEGEMARAFIAESNAFPKEERMYRDTLPRMHELIKEKMRNDIHRIAPRAFSSSSGNLIFEDLGSQGFKMANRQNGLDLQHCLLAMRVLAIFHALSMRLHEEDPALIDYEESIYVEKGFDQMRQFTANCYDTLANNIKKWMGFQKYASKVRELGKVCFDQFIQMKDQTEDRFKVLNHGDFWLNNMMFKYSHNTGEPIDIRVIDHQISRYESLCLDLQYFIFSTPRPDIRTEKMDDMISAYHSTLGKALIRLGLTHRMMSRQDLNREMQRTAIFGVLTTCSVLPIVLADRSDALDLEKFTEEALESGTAGPFSAAMAGKRYASAMKLLLPYWEQKGFL